jgi:hypothetical protein
MEQVCIVFLPRFFFLPFLCRSMSNRWKQKCSQAEATQNRFSICLFSSIVLLLLLLAQKVVILSFAEALSR